MKCEFTWITRIGPVIIFEFNDRNYGLCFCHRNPEHSIRFFGMEKYLCARCLGILCGGIIGGTVSFFGYTIPFPVSLLLLLPLIVDGILQALEIRQSTNVRRLATGVLFGFGIYFCGTYLAVIL
jgi:uncharacterized membrane protein